jgi:subtilisin family serine protease
VVRRTLVALLTSGLVSGVLVQPAAAAPSGVKDRGPGAGLVSAVPGEVLVRFRAGVGRSRRAAIRRIAGVRLEDALRLPRLQLVRVRGRVPVSRAIAALEARSEVVYAEPNIRFRLHAVPNDPLYPNQWGLERIDAPEAWDTETGTSDVVVTVLDSGIEHEHPDLDGNLWRNQGESGGGKEVNGEDDDNNGFTDDHLGWDFFSDDNDPRDPNGHGTHVAGIIGAEGNNGTGVAGAAWDVSLMPLRACGAGGSCDLASVVEAIGYASDMGADVVNMSFGGGFSQAQKDVIDAAPGTLFVASAGNAGTNNDSTPQYPCSHTSPNLICVAASTEADGRWSGSNVGPTSVDLAAPGEGISSTLPVFDTVFSDDFEGTARWNFVESPASGPAVWERTSERSASPTRSIADSAGGGYAANSDAATTTTTPVNLGTEYGCGLRYLVRLQTQTNGDWLRVEAAHGAGAFVQLDQWSGTSGSSFVELVSDLGDFDGETQTKLRFRLDANGDPTVGDGAHIDDVAVRCLRPTASYGPGQGYGELTGTSMAAPHVAGAAALLVAARSDATVAQLKAAILETAEPLFAFSGLTVTGGRLDVGAAMRFVTDTTPPAAFDLLAPANGAIVSTAAPTFSWQPSADPESGVRYQLFVDGAFQAEVDGLQATPTSPLSSGPHSWFVRAVNGMGQVTQSMTTRTFTVEATHPRTLGLRLRKHLVAAGTVAVVDGFAACVDGATVRVQRKRGETWRTIRAAAVGDNGTYRARLRDRPGRYRARVVGSVLGHDLCGEAVSGVARHRH